MGGRWRTAWVGGRWRTASSGVRGRAVVSAVLAVALGLGIGGSLLVLLLDRTLVDGVDSAALARADALARTVAASGPDGAVGALRDNPPVAQLVQVVGPAGRVLASSSARSAAVAASPLRPAPGRVLRSGVEQRRVLDTDDRDFYLARGVSWRGGDYVVLVASSLQSAHDSARAVLVLLGVGSPVLLLLVAVATWALVGRALAPVERIRSRVSAIGGDRLGDRVPVPASSDEIARLAATMNAMLARLERSSTAQRQFVADASHELRSPLTTVVAALDVAGPELAASPELRDVLTQETARMARLVDDLLLLAHSDDEGLRVRRDDVDLDDLLLEEAARLRMSAPAGVAVTVSAHPARVGGDEARIARLLRNLADNAVHHARSRVVLSSGPDPGGVGTAVLLAVDDDGAGVPAPDRARVFDRFVRLEDSRDRGSGGAGLGLAIVREIAAAHGAGVAVCRSPLGGARFVVSFPAPAAEPDTEPDTVRG